MWLTPVGLVLAQVGQRSGFGLEGAAGVFGATATTVLSLTLIPVS